MKIGKKGFTLVEVLIVVGILAVVVIGLFQVFLQSQEAAQIAQDKTLAMFAAQNKMEEIRNHSFDGILSDYVLGGDPGNTFILEKPTGKGVIYVNEVAQGLLRVKVVVCWRDQRGRVIGEDLNLNGVLDVGEDINNNGEIDSIVIIESMMARR